MSQQETVIGKLKLLEKIDGETLEEQCKRVYIERFEPDDETLELCDNFQQHLGDEGWETFVIYNGDLYEAIQKKELDTMDIFNISKNEDGTYDFTLSYYNGGCCFSEAIEVAFRRLEEGLV